MECGRRTVSVETGGLIRRLCSHVEGSQMWEQRWEEERLLAGSMVQEERQTGVGGEQSGIEKPWITPRYLISATGWLWCHFDVRMAEEAVSLRKETGNENRRFCPSLHVSASLLTFGPQMSAQMSAPQKTITASSSLSSSTSSSFALSIPSFSTPGLSASIWCITTLLPKKVNPIHTASSFFRPSAAPL